MQHLYIGVTSILLFSTAQVSAMSLPTVSEFSHSVDVSPLEDDVIMADSEAGTPDKHVTPAAKKTDRVAQDAYNGSGELRL